ncbi:hypothetical protein DV096_12305 [Bradymonadaceae bacterium TMQ3]|uniref:RCC1-like domain-containing protein n=1 Tax=Lujinxingia sediminis TaxID=2480984 RepID=A0ABY0CQZ7_9DELT|nr:hypothetical protein [Lujinxingia sediminis]RDV37885.1 hypothetical protein DV096_12305 [Bradymonadaceae bacterium TMQ3]RVU42782.1 hypothetical protein EA187_14830 [Lujinxingia sediminis]TXC75333.1 hypothetical protein FRC91_11460 [Bradymonadales bacterium TMQ1]
MNRIAIASIAFLLTTTGCIFGVDTSFCENCTTDTDLNDTDTGPDDVGEDTDSDAPDTDTTPDADADPDLSLTLTGGEESFYVIHETEGFLNFEAACAPQGCTLDSCTLSYEGGEPVTLDECGASIELTTDKLNAEGSWTLTVDASLDEQSTSASKTFDVRYAFKAGLQGYEAGESYAFSHPPMLESFCTHEDCELTIACTDGGGDTLECEGLVFPAGVAEVVITLTACATGLEPEHCLPEQVYTFTYQAPTWTQVATGAEHSCGILDDGTLWCWGNNGSGRLGDGSSTQRSQPTRVAGDGVWTQVSAGGQHTCGIKEDGSLWCWGLNSEKQAYPASNAANFYNEPHQINNALNWHTVTAGGTHTCALNNEDELYCWGRGIEGQLGTDTPAANQRHRVIINPDTPTPIDTFVAVAAGDAHTCAVTAEGANGWCWGRFSSGELNGDTLGDSKPRPVGIPVSSANYTTTTISAGGAHSCAYVSATQISGMRCWGSDSAGQLGHAFPPNVHPIDDLSSVNIITTGSEHTCAIQQEGVNRVAYCWGDNVRGQLGHTENTTTVPTAVNGGFTDWIAISAGKEHTCGIADDTMYCWGRNNTGQLGHPGSGAPPTPVAWPYTP